MKIILLFLFFLPSSIFSQQNFWEQTNGPGGGPIDALEVNSNNNVFAGTWYMGIFRSTDDGGNWLQVNNGLTDKYVWSLAINSNDDIFAGTGNGGGIFRSTDNGENWNQVNNGLTNTYVHCLAINSNGDIFAGTNWGGVFRSTNNGENWTEVNNGLTSTVVKSIVITSNDYIFVGTSYGGGVFRSTDNGANWTQINNGLGNVIEINALAINSSNRIFAGSWSDQSNNGGGVYYSTDDGENWHDINNGLTDKHITSLSINSIGDIFAGTNSRGVYRSTDNGANWSEINSGLTILVTHSLAINSNNRIFVGTDNDSEGSNGKGVFRSIYSTTGINYDNLSVPSLFSLKQNYPNPFNPNTTISYTISKMSYVVIKIYNALGKEVTTLVNESKPAGNYESVFDGTNLPSGIYFCKMMANNFSKTIKLILLK